MRPTYVLRSACALLAVASCVGAASAQDVLHRLQAVDQEQNLEDATIQPWHLRMMVQLFGPKGDVKESGTVDEWWAGPDQYRQVFSLPSYTATRLKTPSGLFQTPGSGSPPYVVEDLLRLVTHPVDTADELQNATPVLTAQKLGPTVVDCILLDRRLKGIPHPPLGLYPTYCVQHGNNTLLVRSEISEVSALNAVGSFKGRHFAAELRLLVDNVKVASERVARLEPVPADVPEFADVQGLERTDGNTVDLPSATVAGRAVSQPSPVYPDSAKHNHISGTVVLNAIIGTDGRIHKLSVVSAPDPDLAISAAVAVRQWTYKPYILNGVPVEVKTTINVNYTFGP